MDICIKKTQESARVIYPSILNGLQVAAAGPCSEIIFFSDELSENITEIENFMNLAERLDVGIESIIAATSHPSAALLHKLKELGVRKFMIATMAGGELKEECLYDVESAEQSCCVLLRFRRGNNSMSVCGAQGNMLVLGIRHIMKYCMHNHSSCNHWRMYRKETQGTGKDI